MMNLVNGILTAADCVLLVPLGWHLGANLLSRTSRNFSFVTHAWRYTVLGIVLVLAVAGAWILAQRYQTMAPLWLHAVPLLAMLLMTGARTARRLHVDAATGLVTWHHLALPPFLREERWTRYIDDVRPLKIDSHGDVNLFGLEKLEEHGTGLYNGESYSSGHFSTAQLRRLVESFNSYSQAWAAHDDDDARAARLRFKAERERRVAPARLARRAREQAREEREAASKRQEEERARLKATRAEERRRSRMEAKFK